MARPPDMNRALLLGLVLSGVGVCASEPARPSNAVLSRSCETLTSLAVTNTTITAAQIVDETFAAPGGSGAPVIQGLPRFCRVTATLKPSADSDIRIEVWLPTNTWNGKFEAVGNGAWNGAIGYAAMAGALRRGYATSSTDTGHVGNTAQFALGHPEKLIDFAYRSEHEMTVAAKAVVTAFYGNAPAHSYWNGCSAGGRQALKEAQMFPADYDGIIAGAPGLDWSGRSAQAVRIAHALQDPAARLPAAKTRLLHEAVVQACDGLDGLKDGVIADPTKCSFDPAVLECRNGDASTCLTTAQVATARLIYGLTKGPDVKRKLAGLMPGSELGWTDLGWTASARATGRDQYRFVVFGDPAWDVDKFNEVTDVPAIDTGGGAIVNAINPDLKPFFERGGKLLHYHGWSDPQISPINSVDYYERVVATLGKHVVDDSYRLFMVPGMAHCGGGEGPNEFDTTAALEQWRERGGAPNLIVAAHTRDGRIDRTRPLCPYPQLATYRGTGSVDDAKNFTCRMP